MVLLGRLRRLRFLPVRGDMQAHGDGTAEPDQRCDLSGSDGE
jgi:hypothetical protein